MSSEQANQLVREGIEAIKSGDKQVGRGKLETAVKIDAYNEDAWLWLARVVETDEERRTCLGNVIIINPQNKRAQQMLDQIENRSEKQVVAQAKAQGRQRGFIILGVGLILLLGVIVLGLLLGGGEDVALAPTFTPSFTPSNTPNADDIATALASITPSPTQTDTPSFATWTPTAGPTSTATPQQFPSPPAEVAGRIIMQSGRVAGDDANQPIVLVNPGDLSSKQTVSGSNQRGQLPALVRGQNRFAWAQYFSGTRTYSIQIQNFGITESTSITALYGEDPDLLDPLYPSWGNGQLVFAAKTFGSPVRDLWLLPVDFIAQATPVPTFAAGALATPTPILPPVEEIQPETPEEEAAIVEESAPVATQSILVRLTTDPADKTHPRFDPTGTAVIYAATLDGVSDLFVVNVNSLQVLALTTNGAELAESAPDWGPANIVVFAAAPAGSNETDIYFMNADGSSEPTLLFDFGPRDIQPRWSPDGNYIVFSSDRNGNWDVFIYDIANDTFYGVETNPATIDIANDWRE